MTQPNFKYLRGMMHCDGVSVAKLARSHGTPFYVYSCDSIVKRLNRLKSSLKTLDPLICFSVKANPNHTILELLFKMGCGADVVSGGELARALKAGCDPKKIVFSGVGKTVEEIEFALRKKILQFNVESEGELLEIEKIAARLKCKSGVSLRVNPDVDAKTHPYISTGLKENKFGVDFRQAKDLYKKILKSRSLVITGIDCHIGSQLTEISPFEDAFKILAELIRDIESLGIRFQHIDVGGGIGIRYRDEPEINPVQYARIVQKYLGGFGARIILEPGRFLVGHAGALVSKVLYTKKNSFKKHFTIVDVGFNDFKRPMLYQAWHEIRPVKKSNRKKITTDVVGPICETSDTFATNRKLPQTHPGELIAIMDCGAYGASMASFYNSRPLPLEILVSGKSARVIGARILPCNNNPDSRPNGQWLRKLYRR